MYKPSSFIGEQKKSIKKESHLGVNNRPFCWGSRGRDDFGSP